MIFGRLDQAARYSALGPGFARAFQFLQTFDRSRPDGRCEIEGDAVYANLMSYETKYPPDAIHEVHRRHADVQFLISGQETMYFTPADGLGPGKGYNAEKDYELYEVPSLPSALVVQAGQFVIFFPGEAHKTNLVFGKPAPARKIVVKVRL